jgi:hypothetical protein
MADNPLIGGSEPATGCAPADAPYVLATMDSRLPNASTLCGVIVGAESAPQDTRTLWRDTSTSPATLKYYDGSVWQPFAQTGRQGPQGVPGAGPWSLLTADFTAGAAGAGGLTVSVASGGGFARGAYVMLVDATNAQAFYQVAASPSALNPSALVVTRLAWDTDVAANYVFAVANGALATLSGIAPPAFGSGSSGSGGALEPVVADDGSGPELVFAGGDIVMA